jgi:hypothetical protein
MVQTGNYPQQTQYQLPPQQQFFVGTYPYPTPTVKKFFFFELKKKYFSRFFLALSINNIR